MSEDFRPLSDLVAQGWEVLGFAGGAPSQRTGRAEHAFLLRRQRQHKVLRVRRKLFGAGLTSEEIDL